MVRRDQERRVAEKAAAKEAQQALTSENGDYDPPPEDECDPFSYPMHIDDEGTVTIWDRSYRIDGILRRFSITVEQTVLTGEVVEEARFCCSHGHLHVHKGDDSDHVMKIDDITDLEKAYKRAETMALVLARAIINQKEG